jgi:hypothetical protein
VAVLQICLLAALLTALTVPLVRLRARVRRLEHESMRLLRALATVHGWASKELTSVRAELTVNRVNESAAKIKAQRAQKRAAAATSPPEPNDPEDQRDTLAMPAPVAPRPDDDEGEATHVLDSDPPIYARRATTTSSAALAHPDLIGSEDIADEAALTRLGPDDKTPPHGRCAAMLLPVVRGPEEGSAA